MERFHNIIDIFLSLIFSLEGNILGESLSRQLSARFGGVIPSFAMGFHAIQLPQVVNDCLEQANLGSEADLKKNLSAIAVTNRPGLKGSLMLEPYVIIIHM